MAFKPISDAEAGQAITRLVDGTLSDAERGEVEAWANASPDLVRQVAAQRHVASQLASGGPRVPDRLLDGVENRARAAGYRDRSSHAPGVLGSPRPSRSDRSGQAPDRRSRASNRLAWRPAAALCAVAALAAVIVITTSTGGSSASPSITSAAQLAFVPAAQAAPSASNDTYLDVSYEGVTFPNYAKLNAVPTGELVNRVGGRPALTVFYHLPDGARLSYTVFSGSPVGLPAAARLVRFEGVPLHVYRTSDGLSVVTLVRHGRTCVLAASTSEDAVLGLAAEPVLAQRA